MFYYVLKNLPLKIEFRNSGNQYIPQELLAIGFVHDIVKNSFLLEAIWDEFKRTKNSKILSGKSIVDDIELISFIVDNL